MGYRIIFHGSAILAYGSGCGVRSEIMRKENCHLTHFCQDKPNGHEEKSTTGRFFKCGVTNNIRKK
jgi:hypothetical protein